MFRIVAITVLILLTFGCVGTPDWVTEGPMNDLNGSVKGPMRLRNK